MNFFFLLFKYIHILGLSSSKDNEYPLSSYNSPTSYDELRARNRQEFERTQPNKTVYRYTTILTIVIF